MTSVWQSEMRQIDKLQLELGIRIYSVHFALVCMYIFFQKPTPAFDRRTENSPKFAAVNRMYYTTLTSFIPQQLILLISPLGSSLPMLKVSNRILNVGIMLIKAVMEANKLHFQNYAWRTQFCSDASKAAYDTYWEWIIGSCGLVTF